ncbi:CAZyme family GH16 [Aspergillus niger]|nr:CAZyme family GH16 [Aspergillus niger]KAI3087319.1 CAZyme family GH16 [Aspergillus niger]
MKLLLTTLILPSLLSTHLLFATAISIPSPQETHPDANCDCYITSSFTSNSNLTAPTYFTHYKFWDFRNAPLPQSGPETTQTNPSNPHDTSTLEIYPLTKTLFSHDWRAQTWDREATDISPVPMKNTDGNVFLLKHPSSTPRDPRSSFLVLRTTRFQDHASTAEMEGLFGYIYHCSLRLRMRLMSRDDIVTTAASTHPNNQPGSQPGSQSKIPQGSCAGIFTYRSSICESDIEILTTEDSHTVHYANQPDYDPISDTLIPGASSIVNLTKPWTSWTTHRLDWVADMSAWYADGQLQSKSNYSVPDRPSIVAMNLWSNGGNWSGDMKVGESVFMGIEWIELVYNVTKADQDLSIKDHPGHRDRYHRVGGLGSASASFSSSASSVGGDLVDEEDVERQMGKAKEKSDGCQRPCWIDPWHPV